MLHEMRTENVDEVLVGLDVGIFLSDGAKALVPKWHCIHDAVGLRRRGYMPLALARELEGIAHYAVAAPAREDRFLHDHLFGGVCVHAPADLGVLAFVV